MPPKTDPGALKDGKKSTEKPGGTETKKDARKDGKKSTEKPGGTETKKDGLKDGKKSTEKPGGTETKKERFRRQVKMCLVNKYCQGIASLMALLLISLAVVCYFRCNPEHEVVKLDFQETMAQSMRKYNTNITEWTVEKVTSTIEGVLIELAQRQKRNLLLKSSIDDVLQKLQDGWKLFDAKLYYFHETGELTFSEASRDCKQRNASLPTMIWYEEETFLEDEINARTKQRDSSFWIGLKKNGRWRWESFQPLEQVYWARGFPAAVSMSSICGFIGRCTTRHKCWKNDDCVSKRRWICMWFPNYLYF